MRSAFHDSRRATEPYQVHAYQSTIDNVFAWLNSNTRTQDHPTVFWFFCHDRSTTSAVVQSIAAKAHKEGRLMSSYFFAWEGDEEQRNPNHLIPTITYQIAQFDNDLFRKITEIIVANPDVRDKAASTQIPLLLKEPLMSMDTSVAHELPLFIVIDALDACSRLEDTEVADDISLVIQALTTTPLPIKVLITSRFYGPLQQIIRSHNFPQCQLARLPHYGRTDLDRAQHGKNLSDVEKGADAQ
jgi:hypothetical protein